MEKRAAFTIVSTNYLSHARVLAKSFLKHHKDFSFYVVFVDEDYKEYLKKDEDFIAISYKDIGLLEPQLMSFQYSILEFATAVKPSVFKHLFKKLGYQSVIFFDPDIWVLEELTDILELSKKFSILLTPHTFSPIEGVKTTSEECILKSGIYNLGFIALSNTEDTLNFLNWWSLKLEFDCRVDIKNGIFVDQKWIDLVPNYFESCYILKNKEFNVAKWNLHERKITSLDKLSNKFLVNQKPLGFFHFSGYSPNAPSRLCVSSERYSDLENYPDLKLLCDEYRKQLLDNDYLKVIEKQNSFLKLSNGVLVTEEIREIIRYTRKNGIKVPSIKYSPDLFCTFIFCINPQIYGSLIPPFIEILLKRRPDVRYQYSNDKGVVNLIKIYEWLKASYNEEPRYKTLEPYFDYMFVKDSYTLCNNIYIEHYKNEFPNLYFDEKNKKDFLFKFKLDNEKKFHIPVEIVAEFQNALLFGAAKCLNCIFGNLAAFKERFTLGDISSKDSILKWLISVGAQNYDLRLTDLIAFEDFMKKSKVQILFNLLCKSKNFQNLYYKNLGQLEFIDYFKSNLTNKEILKLENKINETLPVLNELEAIYSIEDELKELFPTPFNSKNELEELSSFLINNTNYSKRESFWKNSLAKETKNFKVLDGYNLFANHQFKGGMGELARSISKSLKYSSIDISEINIPTGNDYLSSEDLNLNTYGISNPAYRENIIVANASALNILLNKYLTEADTKNRKNIAYLTWESESVTNEILNISKDIDEIWVPSSYNQKILAKALEIPVHVVPLIPEIDEKSKYNFGQVYEIPKDYTTYGFFFDANSFMERKNPKAIIDSFRLAFSKSDKALLVLKVFNVNRHRTKYLELRRYADDLPIIWIEDELNKSQLNSLVSMIDVYISLHRSEAFGFTMAEAMKLGKPVIATAYSGNMDFMDKESSCLVNYKIIETKKSYGPYLEGTIWADPDIAHAAYFMRELHLNKEIREELGRKGKEKVEQVLSYKNIEKALFNARFSKEKSKSENKYLLDYKRDEISSFTKSLIKESLIEKY